MIVKTVTEADIGGSIGTIGIHSHSHLGMRKTCGRVYVHVLCRLSLGLNYHEVFEI